MLIYNGLHAAWPTCVILQRAKVNMVRVAKARKCGDLRLTYWQ